MRKFVFGTITFVLLLCIFFAFDASAANNNSYAGIVSTASTALNIRSSASTASTVKTQLPKGSYVTIMEKSSSWYKVEYAKNTYGYCSSGYITKVSGTAKYVNITSGYLNVRSGTGISYSVKAKLVKNDIVIELGTFGSWSKILFNGTVTGYVYSAYLKTYSAMQTTNKMSIPYYSQTDSRWSGTYLGSSGKTLGQIGCTTTCLAMTESFRTGTSIYPNAMAKKLSYSSSGSLYWPSNYVTTTSFGYQTIKSLIDSGKPVIVGLSSSTYGTHWVVVTGYNASVYYINDPGTSSRTTLGQTMAKYPNFYKLAYYK